ncbi:MAG: DUF2279 domain-containing protein [Fluviicola sp.]|nr:DUF2279 domain-containing protein [Fluviicola sp.]
MIRVIPVLLLFLFASQANAQRLFSPSDSLNKKRAIIVSSSITTVWAGSMIGLSQLWYKDIPKSKFHFFNDNKEWLQMDKAGHFYAAHKINQLTSDLFKWSGVNDKTSLFIGTGISIGYQTTFEFFDAYSKDWGFSWGDVAANTLGSLSYLGQELVWGEERIIPKFSAFPTEYAKIRPAVLGSNFAESFLKDYNGQTYWLSFSPGTFFKNSKIPKWACISFGYSVDAKLVGDSETYFDVATGTTYNAKREFLLSLDIDFSRLPIKKPWLKAIVKQFNYLKLPFPSLIVRGDQLVGSWSGW